jgi:signal transduction histidine kinase
MNDPCELYALAKRGWLPPPDATPLQVLATPPTGSRSAVQREQRPPWVSGTRLGNSEMVLGVPSPWPETGQEPRSGRCLPRGCECPPSEVGERQERFAALIGADRTAILASYARSLDARPNPVVAEPCARDQVMTSGAEILADVLAGVRGGDGHPMLVAGTVQAESRLGPADLVRAAGAFFNVAVGFLGGYVTDDPELLPCFITAVQALNESISCRIREATLAYTGSLLESVDQAHIDERRRIARDLHDRLGEGISVALRQLELHEIASRQDPRTSAARAAMAKQALAEAMRRLGLVTSGLRHDSVRSLEKALVRYIDSVDPDAEVRLRVSGDESWAPLPVIDEAFLIIREAVRNALAHGSPRLVLIEIALAPHELLAWVEDNGTGFAADQARDPGTAGTGLASMRERAAMLGGRLRIASVLGQGTVVELLVPLPGHRDE